jgi:hypothetical protein
MIHAAVNTVYKHILPGLSQGLRIGFYANRHCSDVLNLDPSIPSMFGDANNDLMFFNGFHSLMHGFWLGKHVEQVFNLLDRGKWVLGFVSLIASTSESSHKVMNLCFKVIEVTTDIALIALGKRMYGGLCLTLFVITELNKAKKISPYVLKTISIASSCLHVLAPKSSLIQRGIGIYILAGQIKRY